MEQKLGPLMDSFRRIDGVESELAIEAQKHISDLDKMLRAIKDPQARQEMSARASAVLEGNLHPTNLPEDFAATVGALRSVIDDSTGRFVSKGIVEAGTDLAQTLLENDGKYVRRAYRVFTDPKYRPSEELFNRWVNQNVQDELLSMTQKGYGSEMRAARGRVTGVEPNIGPSRFDPYAFSEKDVVDSLKAKYTNIANDLLDRDQALNYLTTGSATVGGGGIFKKRQNLDPLTRELLGQIHDPVFLASETIGRMNKTEALHGAMSEIRQIGLANGMFRTEQEGSLMGMKRLVSESNTMHPLKGLYAEPELVDAFNKIQLNDVGNVMKGFAALSSMAKIPKTLGSLKALSSNFWGGLMDIVAQGHASQLFRPDNYRQAAKNAGYTFGFIKPDGSLDNRAAFEFYKKMMREGLEKPNVQFGDFINAFKMGESTLVDRLPADLVSKMKKGVSVAGKIYTAPGAASKVFSLAGEMDTLRRAGLYASEDEMFREAAKRVRLTSEDFGSVPKAIKKASAVGFLDPFVTYTADRFRVVYNTYKLALQDIKSGNPVLRESGFKRMAWMTSVLGTAGYLGVNSHLTPDQEKAIRNRMPDWDKDGFVRINEPEDDGTVSYTNLNYILPHTVTMEAMQSALRGQSPEEAIGNFITSAGKQAFGENLLVAPLMEVRSGRTERGIPIYSSNDPLYKQFLDGSSYFLDRTFTPLVVNESKKLYQAIKAGEEGQAVAKGGASQNYRVDDILLSNLAGVRISRIDMNERLKLDAGNVARSVVDDQIAFSSQKRRALTEQDNLAAYKNFENRYRGAFDKVTQMVTDARNLGMDDNQIAKFLKDGRVPSSIALGAINGTYIEPDVDPTNSPRLTYEQIKVLDKKEQLPAINAIARENPIMGKSLISRYREDARNEALKISDVDKLMLAQSVTDGERARFINRKLVTMPDPIAQKVYLNQLRNKKILTGPVEAQMKVYK